uniref:Uncharacterized protein n=1 Tax=Lepeophtheirus salmonis TaxID=72036 RepID=A0A0K2VDD5_LEPSM
MVVVDKNGLHGITQILKGFFVNIGDEIMAEIHCFKMLQSWKLKGFETRYLIVRQSEGLKSIVSFKGFR